MATLLYYWDFTGTNNLSLNEAIYDSESSLVAKVKRRGTYNNSSFSRSENGIFLNNNDSTNGGYYIELDGLNSVQWGGNISIEMAIQNDELTFSNGNNKKSLYFSSTNEVGQLTSGGASLVARFAQNKTKFLARPDATSNVSYGSGNPPYRNVNENSPTAITQGNEHHYIFSVQYDSTTGSSLKIYIDGDEKGENTANLEKALTNNVRGSNIIGTNKDPTNTTYLKGVVRYLKIYQNSMSDTQAQSIYNTYNFWRSESDPSTDSEKITMRHTKVNLLFNTLTGETSFSLLGSKLGLTYGTKSYKIWKYIENGSITIDNNYNYIPLQGFNKFIIIIYNSIYYKITQTSNDDGINAKYKLEVSLNNGTTYTNVATNKGFGDTQTYNNVTFTFGGVEVNINPNSSVCFHKDTLIKTDQGNIKIKHLTKCNTIENNKIVYLFRSKVKPDKLVLIKKNAFQNNIPKRDIKLTPNHEIILTYKNTNKKTAIPVSKLVNNDSIKIINNDNSDVYNIILKEQSDINVSNLQLGVISICKKTYYDMKNLSKSKDETNFNLIISGMCPSNFKKNNIVPINSSRFKYFNN